MANWVTTYFTVGGREAHRFLNYCQFHTRHGNGLFKALCPRPATYDNYDTTNYVAKGVLGNKLNIGDPLPGYGKIRTKSGKVTRKYLQAFARAADRQESKYGALGWYDWDCKNWGTRGEAIDVHIEGNRIFFSTAWTFPAPVFERIARKFNMTCVGTFIDEDGTTGTFVIENRRLRVNYP